MKKGSTMSPEAIAKIKASKQHISKETRQKMSISRKGKPTWNKGLTAADPRVANNTRGGWSHTDESRQKISESHKGKSTWNLHKTKQNDERMKLLSESLKGIPKSEETKKAISESKLGSVPFNKGLTKETSEIVKAYSEKSAETIRKQYDDGREVWNKGLSQETDIRIVSGRKGLTRENSEKVNKGAEEQSKKMLQHYNDGLEPWNKGETKHTHPSMISISEKRIEYIMTHKNHASTYISEREIKFKEWFISLGLVEDEDFIHQYYINNITDKYLIDFYFPRLSLVIEFDGEYRHRGREEVDTRRTEEMRNQGKVVLRFLETERKNHAQEEAFAKEQIMKIIKYLIEDKNGTTQC